MFEYLIGLAILSVGLLLIAVAYLAFTIWQVRRETRYWLEAEALLDAGVDPYEIVRRMDGREIR